MRGPIPTSVPQRVIPPPGQLSDALWAFLAGAHDRNAYPRTVEYARQHPGTMGAQFINFRAAHPNPTGWDVKPINEALVWFPARTIEHGISRAIHNVPIPFWRVPIPRGLR